MPDTTIVIRGKNLSGPAMAQLQADVMKTSKGFVDANKSAVQFESTSKKLTGALAGVGGIITTLGVAKLSGDIIKASTTLDTMDRMLTNIEGSADKAKKRFEEFRTLAKLPVLDPFNLSKYYVGLKSVNVQAPLAIGFMTNLANAMAGVGAGN